MIFDVRHYTLGNIARCIREVAREAGSAHVYLRGYEVRVFRDFRNGPDYLCHYTAHSTDDHIIRDICAELGEGERK